MHNAYIRHVENSDSVVLFIHGFLGSPRHFDMFLPLIPKEVAVYNILLAGHGGSVRDFANASMEQWQKQVDDVLKVLTKQYQNIIIAAHSMGTLFAMDAAVKYPDQVKALFLLGMPLKIGVKPTAVVNTLKSFFRIAQENDMVAKAYQNAHSVTLNMRLWEYVGWIPRYLELFEKSKEARTTILNVNTPMYLFQSAKDELVSMKSIDFIPKKPNIHVTVLKTSAHFIYSEADLKCLKEGFGALFKILK